MTCQCSSHNGFLIAKGLKEAEQRGGSAFEFDGVDKRQMSLYLDKVCSVSGSSLPLLHWDEAVLEEQYRRFHNGS